MSEQQEGQHRIQTASVLIRNGMAYLPIDKQMGRPYGAFVASMPVRKVQLVVDELAEALGEVIAAGNPLIDVMNAAEIKEYTKPVLKVFGVRGWRAIDHGLWYSLSWSDDAVTLLIPMFDKKGRPVPDPTKTRKFPLPVEPRVLAEAILNDVATRPEFASPAGATADPG